MTNLTFVLNVNKCKASLKNIDTGIKKDNIPLAHHLHF